MTIAYREGEQERATFGWLNSSQRGTLLLSGRSRRAYHHGRGFWLYQREKGSLCVVGTGPSGLSTGLFG